MFLSCLQIPLLCTVLSPLGTKIAAQAQKDREEKLDTKKQSSIDNFYDFTDTITAQAEKQYSQMGDNNVSNALCMGAVDLIQSKTMQENTTLQYSLQKEVGELSSIIQGKNIAQIRKAQRKNRR